MRAKQCDQKWRFIAELAILKPRWRQNFGLATDDFLAVFKNFGGDFGLFSEFMQNLQYKRQATYFDTF